MVVGPRLGTLMGTTPGDVNVCRWDTSWSLVAVRYVDYEEIVFIARGDLLDILVPAETAISGGQRRRRPIPRSRGFTAARRIH